MKKTLILSFFFICSIITRGQNLVINELMSSNNNFLLDEDGDDSDWIEIYNNSEDTINLSEYHLSDTPDNLTQWSFPHFNILPFEFIVVFASGKDRAVVGNELHTNFSIKAAGEDIFLSYNDVVIHAVPSISMNPNMSYGLNGDGTDSFTIFNVPTPGYANHNSTQWEILTFSHLGGIYEESFELGIFGSSTSRIRYTTDGTTPTFESHLYNHPIYLDNSYRSQANINQFQIYAPGVHEPPNPDVVPKSIVVRAAAFDEEGERVSDVVTHSYFVKELGINHNSLPIISICADHNDLFDEERGIFVPGIYWDSEDPLWTGNYYQRGMEWERLIHIEFYANSNNIGFRQYAGMRTHGGNGRRHPQKGLRLYARSEYGDSHFNHRIFENKPMTTYKRLVIKGFSSSWSQTGVEDYLTSTIATDLFADEIATRPVVLYLNGEYWGLYYLQERIDERYLAANFGVDEDSVDLIEDWWGGVVAGSFHSFNKLYNYISNNDLSVPSNYNALTDQMDIDNFIDYQLFQIFIANKDWPVNNMKCWKPRNGGKWRWIFFDGDAGLEDLEHQTYAKALSTEDEGGLAHSTMFLRKLLKNPTFKNKFFLRFEELLNTALSYQNTEEIYQYIVPLVGNEINQQITRFAVPTDYDAWQEKLNQLRYFLSLRACEMQKQVKEYSDIDVYQSTCQFNKPDIQNMSVSPNPNNGNFTLTFNSSTANAVTIIIRNTLGQVVQARNMVVEKGDNSMIFNEERLPNGVLFLNIFANNRMFGVKIVSISNYN